MSLRRTVLLLMWPTMVIALALPVWAQYPGQVAKPSQDTPNLRAVAVLEWTGDESHPKASRLVPVSVFDGQELQDGGIYLARPQPLALAGEVEYELKDNGKTVGLYELTGTGQEQGSWVGYGAWKPVPVAMPKPAAALSAHSGGAELWGGDEQSDRPVLHRKAHPGEAPAAGKDSESNKPGASAPASSSDPDRPTLHKKPSSDTASGSSGDASATPSPASDPDRPTLHKRPSSDTASGSASDTSASSSAGSAPDPDRPTLHKKTSDDSASSGTAASDPDRPTLRRSKKKQDDVGHVESLPDVTDPDRPRLKRGKAAADALAVIPSLMGLPPDMQQAVAVSDAKNRPEHLWSYAWANAEDEPKLKAALEDIARKALGLTPPLPAVVPAPRRTPAQRRAKPAPTATPPPPAPLVDEQFRVFELAYSSGATLVLTAHSGGQGAQDKFVTLVAQPDLYGNVLVLLKSITDASHLDVTPRMRLVDAVDAMADNRGELLFELRGATQRQFALYRVLRGQVEKLFVSGPGDIALSASQ